MKILKAKNKLYAGLLGYNDYVFMQPIKAMGSEGSGLFL